MTSPSCPALRARANSMHILRRFLDPEGRKIRWNRCENWHLRLRKLAQDRASRPVALKGGLYILS